jgi:hypothetical protein
MGDDYWKEKARKSGKFELGFFDGSPLSFFLQLAMV